MFTIVALLEPVPLFELPALEPPGPDSSSPAGREQHAPAAQRGERTGAAAEEAAARRRLLEGPSAIPAVVALRHQPAPPVGHVLTFVLSIAESCHGIRKRLSATTARYSRNPNSVSTRITANSVSASRLLRLVTTR